MTPTYYSEISEGSTIVHQHILAAAKENLEIESLYKGCQLLFSPLLERPKILLIGFNSRRRILQPEKLQEENSETVKSFTTSEEVRVLGYKRNQWSIISMDHIIKKLNFERIA